MARRGFILTFLAGAVIAPHRILGVGADDNHVVQAADGDAKTLGVSDLGADAAENRIDVIMSDVAEVEYGAAVSFGDLLMPDADGKAIVATAGKRTVGVAMASGVAGDIGEVFLSQGKA